MIDLLIKHYLFNLFLFLVGVLLLLILTIIIIITLFVLHNSNKKCH